MFSFCEWLLDRNTETELRGWRLKHDIVCSILHSCDDLNIVSVALYSLFYDILQSTNFDSEYLDRMRQYRAVGVLYVHVDRDPVIAMEGAA